MRTVKPFRLGSLTRPYKHRGQCQLGIASLAMVSMEESSQRLLPESALWKLFAQAAGPSAILDAAIPKLGGEFLVSGLAFPRDGSDRTHSAVSVNLAGREKRLSIFGDRYWMSGSASRPLPFDAMPIDAAHAFGGAADMRNPQGKGLDPVDVNGLRLVPLPNIETPGRQVAKPGDRPEPAGFGPVDIMDPSRARRAGTYDDRWREFDFPGFAEDVDWHYFNIAPGDQWLDVLAADAPFELVGLHPSRPVIRGRLPDLHARCFVRRRGSEALDEVAMRLTTAWFIPHLERLILVYHGAADIAYDDGGDVTDLMHAIERTGEPRPAAHYAEVLRLRTAPRTGGLAMLKESDLVPAGLYVDEPEWGLAANPKRSPQLEEARLRHQVEMTHLDEKLGPYKADADTPAAARRPPRLPETFDQLHDFYLAHKADAELGADGSKTSLIKRSRELRDALSKVKQAGHMPGSRLEGGPPRIDPPPPEAQALYAGGRPAPDMQSLAMSGYLQTAHLRAAAPRQVNGKREQVLEAIRAGISLGKADLTGADLSQLTLTDLDFEGAQLEGADFSGATLTGCRFRNAVLSRARFAAATMARCHFDGANLGKSELSDLEATECTFEGAIFEQSRWNRVRFKDCRFAHGRWRSLRADGVEFAGTGFVNCTFMQASMKAMRWHSCKLERTAFVEADFEQCAFESCELAPVLFRMLRKCAPTRFSQSRLHQSFFSPECGFAGSRFDGCQVSETSLRGLDLSGADFGDAVLDGLDFSEAKLMRCSFDRASAQEALFIRADLSGASLRAANLAQAIFKSARLNDACFDGASLYQSDLSMVEANAGTSFDQALTTWMNTKPVLRAK